jgi:predicted permease
VAGDARTVPDEVVGDSARALTLTFAAVGLVLLIICANLALLLLARSDQRLWEFATRKAMGASGAQLIRLALAESMLVAVAGGFVGVALAYRLLPFLIALAPAAIPRLAEATIDARVLLAATLATLLTACAFGAAPALRLSRVSVAHALKRAGSRATGAGASLRSALVLGQIATAVVLCVLAGLVGRTFLTLRPDELGFAPESLSGFVVYVDPRIYPDATNRYHRLTEMSARLAAVPGVTAAGFAQDVPFSGADNTTIVRAAERADAPELAAERRAVSMNYFALLRIPLRLGRTFDSGDGPAAARVAIVNETLARKLDPGGDVLGRLVRVGRSADAPPLEIVGVAADTRTSGSTLDVHGEVYVPSRRARRRSCSCSSGRT